MAGKSETWTYVDGEWHEGNVLIAGPRTHAFWMGSSVFDGARAFEGVMPDLDRHAERLNNSARALMLKRKKRSRPMRRRSALPLLTDTSGYRAARRSSAGKASA